MAEVREWVLSTPHSGIRRMLEHARQAPQPPVMLVNGDPNFTTPEHIIEGARSAALAGGTGYAPGDGLVALRERIVDKVRDRNGIDATLDQVCVTTGACGGLYTTLMLLLDPGDEILLPDPGWSNYAAMVHLLMARGLPYRLDPDDGWAIDLEAVEASITPKTKVILINSPGNPTGAVLSRSQLEALLRLAAEHDLWVVSDEAYDELVFTDDSVSPASLGWSDRVITIFSFSKTYAMTGWRVGYVVGPPSFVRQLSLHQEPVVSCASTVSQHAAVAALDGPQDCVGMMIDAYRGRRDVAEGILGAAGIPYIAPSGGFFMMVDVRESGLDSWGFAMAALQEPGVGVVPGAAFGEGGEGFVRVTLAASDEAVQEGVSRIVHWVQELASSSDQPHIPSRAAQGAPTGLVK